METILPVLEELIPKRKLGKKFGKRTVDKERRCLWRKLGRVKKRLNTTRCAQKAASLLFSKQKLEKQLKESYDSQG